jgi:hypothetical protein
MEKPLRELSSEGAASCLAGDITGGYVNYRVARRYDNTDRGMIVSCIVCAVPNLDGLVYGWKNRLVRFASAHLKVSHQTH